MARGLMFQGTGSDVGKTVLVAGLCRLAHRHGIKVLPFKPQNMSNNAAVADDGGEIGRGQWLQAFACNVEPSVHMNPVLLKPQSQTGSQIIVHGKMSGYAKGADYQKLKHALLSKVMASYQKLAQQCDLVLVEGAGSPAEINLRQGDIANMGFAREANIPVILIGDIDRGGVIASLVGTHTILAAEDRALVNGYMINKFRGDITLFDDGIAAIHRYTNWPCYGIIPWLNAAQLLPAEDSMFLDKTVVTKNGKLKIAVPILPHIANFDDLDPLLHESDIDLIFVKEGTEFPDHCDAIILPGSKSTIADMRSLRQLGWADRIIDCAGKGKTVIGICGGFQMLGRKIYDFNAQEGQETEADGLQLLDITTKMEQEKITRNVKAVHVQSNLPLKGYEIHLGHTTGADCARPAVIINGKHDGAMSQQGNIWGTYLHGLFQADEFRQMFIKSLGAKADKAKHFDRLNDALDAIAIELERSIDVDELFALAR